MTKNDIMKLVVTALVLLAFIAVFTLIALFDVDLGIVKILSVKTILGQHSEVEKATDTLLTQEQNYKTAIQTVQTAIKSYDTEKAKYDAISDETIEIIKKATTQEKYDIEYIWVTLGNYARVNNLAIILVEPGGTQPVVEETIKKDATDNQKESESSSSSSTSNQSSTSQSQTPQPTTPTTPNATANNILSVEITGNYLNVADFIYEVENDKELRFRLDNISMQYVGNNNVKTTFNIKNLVVVK